ncbi:uncharacterized protein LOC132786033 [Drosophila nasuta]|uniref:Uncharacterized protein LOC117576470 n=1 Tax=Drosophila albomicans TaxID=7291 RepID=A0A6P8ZEW9_DROAB|nr:uncharacterized protein LOC117576470 [Drosophila albomicans]XP_060648394.1 uncharacterized protein LOC132786033 [Drosophila nasuta]
MLRALNFWNFLGFRSSKSDVFNIQVPNIPKLSDSHNYWYWRILLRAYLEAIGLWSGNAPLECPQSKFILLSTIELWLLSRDYEAIGAIALFNDLYLRFGMGRINEI